MITREHMFEPMLIADPAFAPAWSAFVIEWQGENELPLYIALTALARHLIGKLAEGDTARFDAVFDVVERWHVEGTPSVREAASIGLLEDLQNGNLHRTTTPSAFLPWLRPVSRRWWDKVEAFWETGSPLQDDDPGA